MMFNTRLCCSLEARSALTISWALALLACGDGQPATNIQSATVEDAAETREGTSEEDTQTLGDSERERTETPRLVDLVDPRIGTGGVGWNVGSAVPGATAPFGMVRASPDTYGPLGDFPAFHCAGYHSIDDIIKGFSHTHLHGVGIPEYGNVMVMPTRGSLDVPPAGEDLWSGFDDDTEDIHPGYYSVILADTNIQAEMTATTRAAHHRWTYPQDTDDAMVVLDLEHTVPEGEVLEAELVDLGDGIFQGRIFQQNAFSERYGGVEIFFAARFEPPPVGSTITNERAVLAFDKQAIEAQIGISFISAEEAQANLDAEMPTWDFDDTRQATEDAWEDILSVVRFEGGTNDERVIMATALYHAFMMPTTMTDVSGQYRGFDGDVHLADRWTYYSDLSLWDTYRTLHPLLTLVAPTAQRDMMRSLQAMMEQGGWLPKWPQGTGYSNVMVGTPADIVIAETVMKGIDDFDVEACLDNMLILANEAPTGTTDYEGRVGVKDYVSYGYLPSDKHGESVSKTLEFAYADFAIARLAEQLGDADLAAEYDLRATTAYAHFWDADTQFLRGKDSTGEFPGLDELAWDPYYTEGDAWQYLWFVPWDADGLVSLFPSTEAYVDKLQTFMEEGRNELEALRASRTGLEEWEISLEALAPPKFYWHGNEPDIHAPYMFLAAGRPDLTQYWVRWIIDAHHSTQPDGLAGNDDAGTLSAWYVFSALGLYPLAGTTSYFIGTPLFPRAEVDVPGGVLVIEAPDVSSDAIYVQSVSFDGIPVEEPMIDHTLLSKGGTLHFEMAAEPSDWGR